jgi:hexokinase
MAAQSYIEQYTVSTSALREIIQNFHNEMTKGLEKDSANGGTSSLKMLPSFVTKPNRNEKGTFFALDLGGTNFRVLRLQLLGNGQYKDGTKQQFTISKEVRTE